MLRIIQFESACPFQRWLVHSNSKFRGRVLFLMVERLDPADEITSTAALIFKQPLDHIFQPFRIILNQVVNLFSAQLRKHLLIGQFRHNIKNLIEIVDAAVALSSKISYQEGLEGNILRLDGEGAKSDSFLVVVELISECHKYFITNYKSCLQFEAFK